METVGVIKSSQDQKYLSLHPQTKNKRIKQLEYIISTLSGSDKSSDEYQEFFKDLLKHNFDLTNKIVKDKTFNTIVYSKLSAEDTLTFQTLLQVNGTAFQMMKSFLIKRNLDFLAPLKNVTIERKTKLNKFVYNTGKMTLYTDVHRKGAVKATFLKTDSLYRFAHACLDNYTHTERLSIGNEQILLFSGDKGGNVGLKANSLKLGLQIPRKGKPQDIHDYYPYAMFTKAPDNLENMRIMLHEYLADIEKLEKENRIFVTGDFNFISDTLGHQGSSSAYPNPFNLVPLTHLREYHTTYPDEPHSLDNPNCRFAIRETSSFFLDFVENHANNTTDLRTEGKFSNSIVGDPIFPLDRKKNLLEIVILPGVHIIQGTFGKVWGKFTSVVQSLDNPRKDVNTVVEMKKNIRSLEKEVKAIEDKVNQEITHEITDLENFKNCAEMEEFPNLGDKTCEAEKCIEIERDSINDYSYIECDNCKEWFHCLCEGKFILLTIVFSTIQLK